MVASAVGWGDIQEMFNIGPENVLDYLRRRGHLAEEEPARAEALAWGVSNIVLRIVRDEAEDFVVKQSRGQLRTAAAWYSRLDRIWRETDFMTALAEILPPGGVPRVLFEEREDYLFGMEAVAADHLVWKAELLAGRADARIAALAGNYLARIHRETAFDAALQHRWMDNEVFVQLRVDPFYRRVAEVYPELYKPIKRMIEEMFRTALCAVHADFSPKNILITGGNISLVDFETGHYGDPAFDLGFFLSHLLLKTVLHAGKCERFLNLAAEFWNRYSEGLDKLSQRDSTPFAEDDLQRRTIMHLAGCMLARIDGTSTIDYLPGKDQQDLVRRFCRELFFDPPDDLEGVFTRLRQELQTGERGP